MTNLDSILKSRDTTLPTKVLLVKAMVFPIIMYGCESSRNIKKTESQRIDAFGMWRWNSGKESTCQCRKCRRLRFSPWVGKIPWSRKCQHTPVFLPGESHGQCSLEGYSPWGREELDRTVCTQVSYITIHK